jgi:hypothetical protein
MKKIVSSMPQHLPGDISRDLTESAFMGKLRPPENSSVSP